MTAPIILVSPGIKVGPTGALNDIKSHSRSVTLDAKQDYVDAETFTNLGGEAPGKVTWSLSFEVLQSFGANGVFNLFNGHGGELWDFEVLPDDRAPVADSNPQAIGQVWVPTFGFLDASVGETSKFNLDLKVFGAPSFIFA